MTSPSPMLHKNHDIYFVPGLRRGLLVLEMLAKEARPMSVADIARELEITRSSMFRLAYTLLHLGFVEEVADSRMLALGPRALNIGYAYLASKKLLDTARPDPKVPRDRTDG